MKRLLYIIIGIACLCEAKAQAPLLPDTLDEEALQAMRDTATMSRRNIAAETKTTVNLRDYIVKDTYSPSHQSFSNAWYTHLYIGGSLGIEQIKPQVDDYECRFMSNINLLLGKQLNLKSDLRLALGAGEGYEKNSNVCLKRLQGKLDYIYNLSTHYQGYNPARRMEVSLLGGIGANYVWNSTPKFFAPEAHVGLQLKCFTGPMGTINIEPYVGISSDKIDMSGTRNWRGYDAFYGINVNYSFFLDDNLNKESRDKLLRSRMADDRLINAYTLEKWRTPWFFEYGTGVAFANSSHMAHYQETMGSQTSIGIGRWLSPVMGFRLSGFTRSTKWLKQRVEDDPDVIRMYNSNYAGARLEALFNPLGFSKSFKWNSPAGAYLTFGYGMGLMRKFNEYQIDNIRSEVFNIGAHIWGRVTDNMQVFIEPRFGRNIYVFGDPSDGDYFKEMSFMGDNALTIEAGITMLIRSQKYKNPEEMDHTQNYTYRHIRGFRIGLNGGMPIFQKDLAYYRGNNTNYNASLAFEYRFNHLHSVRLMGDYMTMNYKNLRESYNKEVIFGSLDYEISLTNLFAGRLVGRNLEVEGFLGPTAAIITHTKVGEDNLFYGGNAGLKISYHIWNGIYAVVTPQMYLINNLPHFRGLTTNGIGNLHLIQSMNIGVQYKIGKIRLNPEKVRRMNRERDSRWEKRQAKKLQQIEEKQAAKIAKRHNK